jgi:hypothetical protein
LIRTFPNEATPLVEIRETLVLEIRERTLGSKTFQYQEEEKTIPMYSRKHFLSSGERKGNSPNSVLIAGYLAIGRTRLRSGVIR